jgi:hypothetical protein
MSDAPTNGQWGTYPGESGVQAPDWLLVEDGQPPREDPFAEHEAAKRAELAERGKAYGLTAEEVGVAELADMELAEYSAFKGAESVDDVQAAMAAIERDRAAEAEVDREAALARARARRRAA